MCHDSLNNTNKSFRQPTSCLLLTLSSLSAPLLSVCLLLPLKSPAANQLKAPHYSVFIQFSHLLRLRMRIMLIKRQCVHDKCTFLSELVEVKPVFLLKPIELKLSSSNTASWPEFDDIL